MRVIAIAVVAAAWLAYACQVAGALTGYRLLKLDGQHVKWGSPQLGTGATVTYGFVVEPMRFPGARNCATMAPVAPMLGRIGMSEEAFRAEVEAAFSLWSQAAAIAFRIAESPHKADILIGAQMEPRGRAFANVSLAEQGMPGARSIARSLVCLNPLQAWKIGFGGDDQAYDIRVTIAHEIGHAIGLDHPGADGQLMGFRYDERFRGPQAGDIDGAVALYGARITAAGPASAAPPANADSRSAPLPDAEDAPQLGLGPGPPGRKHPFARLPHDRP